MPQKTEIYDLAPLNGRKSFYGKAKVIHLNGKKYLRSFSTIMGWIDETGREHRCSDHRSNPTNQHVKSFFANGFWKLPLEKSPTLTIVI